MSNEITRLLNSYHTQTLRQMAEAAGIDIKDERGRYLPKDRLHAQLKNHFFTCKRVSQSLAQLSPLDRQVLDSILLMGKHVSSTRLKHALKRKNLIVETPSSPSNGEYFPGIYGDRVYCGNPMRESSRIFEDILARLTYRGLVFCRPPSNYTTSGIAYKLRFHPTQEIFIPAAIRSCLPTPKLSPKPSSKIKPAYTQVVSSTSSLLRDLYFYWDYVRQNSPKILKTGNVGKRDLKAINQQLLNPVPDFNQISRETDPAATPLRTLRILLQELQLIHIRANRLQITTLQKNGIPAFWTHPIHTQVAQLLGIWQNYVGMYAVQLGRSQVRVASERAQQHILNILTGYPPDDWILIDEFCQQVQDDDPLFLFPFRNKLEMARQSSYNTFFYLDGLNLYGKQDELLAECDAYEMAFIRRYLQDALFTLGLIEFGLPGKEQPPYTFRPTTLGRVVLFHHSPPATKADDTGKVVLQPNYQLLAIGPVALTTLATLDLFAERVRAEATTIEYKISRQSVYRAQQADISTDTIIQWLADITGRALPQNVLRSLQEWGAHHRRIVFRRGVDLLQTIDSATMEKLRNIPTINQLIAHPLAPTMAILRKNSQSALKQTLYQHDMLPARGSTSAETVNGSVQIQPDGKIIPVFGTLGLYLRGRLERYAVEMDDGVWRLTEDSVRRNVTDKKGVLAMLDDLQQLNRGALPPEIVTRVKSWGGYYGAVALETLTLIEFQDAEIMAELMKHPRLRGAFTPFLAEKRALAIVTADKVSHVKTVLSELRISVRSQLYSPKST